MEGRGDACRGSGLHAAASAPRACSVRQGSLLGRGGIGAPAGCCTQIGSHSNGASWSWLGRLAAAPPHLHPRTLPLRRPVGAAGAATHHQACMRHASGDAECHGRHPRMPRGCQACNGSREGGGQRGGRVVAAARGGAAVRGMRPTAGPQPAHLHAHEGDLLDPGARAYTVQQAAVPANAGRVPQSSAPRAQQPRARR
jgi:hypothetical protein